MTDGFRTVFLAVEPTWEGWLNALQENWVVAQKTDHRAGEADCGRSRSDPEMVAKKRPNGPALEDHYHQFHLPNPQSGRHTATAMVRVIGSEAESFRTVEFGA